MAGESASIFTEALVLLGGAVVAAPLFRRIGLGTVLGYLAAGAIIGTVASDLFGSGEEILHVAELGVVLLLFIIGLELKPSRLWALRHAIFGLGLAQVVVTGLVLAGLAWLFGEFSSREAIIVGFGLALSSTAFAMQILEESGDTNREYGQTGFSILLFQDLAIVPLLALIPLLAPWGGEQEAISWSAFAIAVASFGALIVAGLFLLNPLFRVIANTGAREAMIAAALFVVLGSAMLMQFAGLSMAMGAFIAGVLLAESSYRHELEADLEPFRGILLGLFFMAVGMSLDIAIITENWLTILIAVPLLMVIKSVLIYCLCRLFGTGHEAAIRVGLLLPQGGEFGFVLFSGAAASFVLSGGEASLLIAIATLSMALTPLAVRLAPLLIDDADDDDMEEDFAGAGSGVLMIGFSRFGQVASQTLLAGGLDVTIIDHSADRVRAASKFGFRIYFGDGTRKDVLLAAGIRHAKLVAVCTHKKKITDKIVNLIQSEYPQTKLYVRSYDRAHTLSLRERGVDYEARETFESGLLFGKMTLQALGVDEVHAQTISDDVRRRDAERLAIQQVEGIYAGSDMLHKRPVTPEPLIKPSRESRRLDKKASARDGPDAD